MVPLFPLPNVVLFPKAYLPLHIFEHRYRAMVREALDRPTPTIGMVVLRAGWQSASGPPPIYATGCACAIVQHRALPDGRYNIVLRGTRRFRVRTERSVRPYREADVEWLDEDTSADDAATLHRLRARLDALLLPAVTRGEARVPPHMADDELVNAVCQALDVDIVEKLALLECGSVVDRASRLIDRLERLVLEHGDGTPH